MYQLTPTQQQALTTFKETGELGILSNLLIEHCLEELKNNEEARNKFNKQNLVKVSFHCLSTETKKILNFLWYDGRVLGTVTAGSKPDNSPISIYIIQTLLSTTPDGAVMSFLDVPVKEIQKVVITTYHRGKLHVNYEYNIGRFAIPVGYDYSNEKQINNLDALTVCNVTPTTLRQQLSQKYHNLITEQSKTPEEALLEITKTYINHFYI